MYGQELTQNTGFVQIPPQDLNDAAVDSEYVSLANYSHATVYVMVGDTAGGTFAVTLNEATAAAGTGEQTLTYTNARSTGQKLIIGATTGTYQVGESITGSGSSLTAEIYKITSDYLIVRCLTGGTTWTDGETLTGGTSGATSVISGTGQDEDILIPFYTAPSSTITVPAVTFKTYAIEVDADSLTVADGYDHFQVAITDPGAAVIAGACVQLSGPRHRGIPMPGALGNQKIVATSA